MRLRYNVILSVSSLHYFAIVSFSLPHTLYVPWPCIIFSWFVPSFILTFYLSPSALPLLHCHGAAVHSFCFFPQKTLLRNIISVLIVSKVSSRSLYLALMVSFIFFLFTRSCFFSPRLGRSYSCGSASASCSIIFHCFISKKNNWVSLSFGIKGEANQEQQKRRKTIFSFYQSLARAMSTHLLSWLCLVSLKDRREIVQIASIIMCLDLSDSYSKQTSRKDRQQVRSWENENEIEQKRNVIKEMSNRKQTLMHRFRTGTILSMDSIGCLFQQARSYTKV